MVTILAAAICVLMAVSVVLFPLGAMMLYAATASYADGFAVSQVLGEAGFFDPVMNLLLVALVARAMIKVLGVDERVRSHRAVLVLCCAMVCWAMIGTFVKGGGLQEVLALLPYLGVPYVVILLAFAERDRSERYIVILVFLQVALATAVVAKMPGFERLRGQNFTDFGNIAASQTQASIFLPNASTVKGLAGGQYAQFHNPNALGLYAVAALSIGGLLLIRKRHRLAGVSLLLAGTFLWVNSLTRGPLLGIILAVIAYWIMRRRGQRTKVGVGLLLGLLMSVGGVTLWQAGLGDYLLPESQNVSVTTRLEGYAFGWDQVLQYPWFGVPVDFDWPPLLRPHALPLLFAAQYGIVMGLGITWLAVWLPIRAGWVALRNPTIGSPRAFLTLGAAGSTLGIGMTNNFAAPALFAVLLGYSIQTLVEPKGHGACEDCGRPANEPGVVGRSV